MINGSTSKTFCLDDKVPFGVTAKDNRLFVEAVLYRYRAGIPWRDLPERFGDFRVVHTRFSLWSKSGVWKRVFEHLADEADNEYAMIDATIVSAYQHSAGEKGETQTKRRLVAAKGDYVQRFVPLSMLLAIRLLFTSPQAKPCLRRCGRAFRVPR
jgi:transposase